MPGYLVSPIADARGITVFATGDISATNLQDALAEIASEKATALSVTAVSSSVTTVQNNLNTTNTTLSAQISSVEGVALLGL